MSPDTYILVSGTLSFGVPMALALHQVWTVDGRGGGWPWSKRVPKNPKTPPTGSEPPRPVLPECLISTLDPDLSARRLATLPEPPPSQPHEVEAV